MAMTALKSAVLAALLPAIVVVPALAREFTDTEKQGLADAIQKFDAAMRGEDFATAIDASVPPKLLAVMSSTSKLPPGQFKAVLVGQMQQTMKSVTIDSYNMDFNSTGYEEAPDGTPFALVPTVIVMEVGKARVKSSALTLGIIDDGAWYLLNVGQAQQANFMRSAYPSFADISFPEAQMEPAQ